MNKTVVLSVLVGLLAVGAVAAYGFGQGGFASEHHEDMEAIVEDGSFEDLEAFRAENGFGGPWWVDDEESFEQWQARHESMEGKGFQARQGMGRGRHGGMGGCPYMGG